MCTLGVIYYEFPAFAAHSAWFLPEVTQAGRAQVLEEPHVSAYPRQEVHNLGEDS